MLYKTTSTCPRIVEGCSRGTEAPAGCHGPGYLRGQAVHPGPASEMGETGTDIEYFHLDAVKEKGTVAVSPAWPQSSLEGHGDELHP